MRTWLTLGIAVATMIAGGGVSRATPPAFDTTASTFGRPAPWPETVTHFPNGVIALPDVIYSQHLHYRPLRMDIYRPEAGGPPRSLIVHVHGGAWMLGTKRDGGPIRDFPGILAAFASRGFVVASVEYRLDGEAHFPASIKDVKEAIQFLRRNAQRYGIDPDRVGIFGGSAGGQLSALAGVSCGVQAFEPDPTGMPGAKPLPPVSDCVQAAVPWYGVHDFQTVPTPPGQPGPAGYLGCPTPQCPADKMIAGSPVTYIDPRDPPMLLIHGLADTLVAVTQTQEFERKLRAAHVPVEALYIPNVDHGLVGKTPETTAAANRQAFDATFDFFERILKPGR